MNILKNFIEAMKNTKKEFKKALSEDEPENPDD